MAHNMKNKAQNKIINLKVGFITYMKSIIFICILFCFVVLFFNNKNQSINIIAL